MHSLWFPSVAFIFMLPLVSNVFHFIRFFHETSLVFGDITAVCLLNRKCPHSVHAWCSHLTAIKWFLMVSECSWFVFESQKHH